MRINHNIPSLRALHQLDKSNSRLDKTLERLSSGLRINHAADDAAGLAITQKNGHASKRIETSESKCHGWHIINTNSGGCS